MNFVNGIAAAPARQRENYEWTPMVVAALVRPRIACVYRGDVNRAIFMNERTTAWGLGGGEAMASAFSLECVCDQMNGRLKKLPSHVENLRHSPPPRTPASTSRKSPSRTSDAVIPNHNPAYT